MVSSFMGIEIGKRSVLTHQAALNTTGHNVANANTEGYSRQVADIVTTIPYPVPSLTDGQRIGQYGTGVDIDSINRIRDSFVDGQIRSENQVYGYWKQVQDGLDKVETIINEPTDDGLRSVMDQFWQSWQDLSANPESDAVRSVVVQRGLAMSEAFKATYKELGDLLDDTNASVKLKMDDINTIATNIADLNQQILAITSAGLQPNDLLDKRDLLVEQLSSLADVEVFTSENGMINIELGDRLLVQGKDTYKLATVADDQGMNMVIWEDTQLAARFTNGEMKGLLDLRGKTDLRADRYSDYEGLIPNMINELNELAKTLVVKINEVHRAGYSLENKEACPDGTDFFTMPDEDPDVFKNWADSMVVNQDLIDDVKNLACAQHKTWETNSDGKVVRANFGDGSNALAIAQLKHSLNETIYPVKTEGFTVDFNTADLAAHQTITIRIDNGSGPQDITLDPPANYRDLKAMADALQEEIDSRDLGVKVRIEGKDDGSGGEIVLYSTTLNSLEFMYGDSGFTNLAASGLQNGEYSLAVEQDDTAAGADAESLNLVQQYLQGHANTIFDAATVVHSPDNINASIEITIADINTANNEVTYSIVSHEYDIDGNYTAVPAFMQTITFGGAGDTDTIVVGGITLDISGLTAASEAGLVEGDKAVYNVVAANTGGTYQKLTIAADYNHNDVGNHSQSFVFNYGSLNTLTDKEMHFFTLNDNPRSDEFGKTYDGFITMNTDTLAAPAAGNGASAFISYYDPDNVETFMIQQQTTDDFWRGIAAEVGVRNQEATRMVKNEDTLLNELETKRQSVSGVSLDEEMTNMIKFNHGFSAASRFITTIDEQLDIIVNRMGTVGR